VYSRTFAQVLKLYILSHQSYSEGVKAIALFQKAVHLTPPHPLAHATILNMNHGEEMC
jgi:hypothetical protein